MLWDDNEHDSFWAYLLSIGLTISYFPAVEIRLSDASFQLTHPQLLITLCFLCCYLQLKTPHFQWVSICIALMSSIEFPLLIIRFTTSEYRSSPILAKMIDHQSGRTETARYIQLDYRPLVAKWTFYVLLLYTVHIGSWLIRQTYSSWVAFFLFC